MKTTKTTIPTDFRNVTDKGSVRYALSGVCIASKPGELKAVAVATDGRCLAALPVQLDGEPLSEVYDENNGEFAVLPHQLLHSPNKKRPQRVVMNGRVEIDDKIGDYVDGRFPAIGYTLAPCKQKNLEGRVAVTIDVALLAAVASALQTNDDLKEARGVTLLIDPEDPNNSPVLVSAGTSGGVGVVMPMVGYRDSSAMMAAKWKERSQAIVDRLPGSLRGKLED